MPERVFKYRFYRPFSLENYNPSFIVNPCKESLEGVGESLASETPSLSESILPEEAKLPDFRNYLDERALFVQKLVSLDYQHYVMGLRQNEADKPVVPSKRTKSETNKVKSYSFHNKETLIAFITDWISTNTDFRRDAISTGTTLCDLRLDIIKANELIDLLKKEFNLKLSVNTNSFAKMHIGDLVDIFLANRKKNGYVQGHNHRQSKSRLINLTGL